MLVLCMTPSPGICMHAVMRACVQGALHDAQNGHAQSCIYQVTLCPTMHCVLVPGPQAWRCGPRPHLPIHLLSERRHAARC